MADRQGMAQPVTELEAVIAAMIETDGPLGIDQYMTLCLSHPQHGYYMKRDPFGQKGDFITAPEVSPLFGELIGIWFACAYEQMGRPPQVNLVELGPGRGTLMADMLKAAKVMPGFVAAARVHLVEISPVLRQIQKWKVPVTTQWHDDLATVPEGPTLILANEFFDALPIRQYQRLNGQWAERVVGSGGLGLRPANLPGLTGEEGDIIEYSPSRIAVAQQIGERLQRGGGAALIIDYGHLAAAPGDTLQALHRHQKVPVTHLPGESDITSHVDFEALGYALTKGGAFVPRAMTQRQFLLNMGIEIRASVLAGKADKVQLSLLFKAVDRLVGEDQMGQLFKVMAAMSPNLAAPYPFGVS